MGLIYVNPEGPNGEPDRLRRHGISGRLCPHGDERRGDRCAHCRGHSFGKLTARHSRAVCRPEPEGANIEDQGFGWKNKLAKALVGHHRSGLEVIWTTTPTKWSNNFFTTCSATNGSDEESGGAHHGHRRMALATHGAGCARSVQAAFALHADHGPRLRFDPAYEKISRASTSIRSVGRRVCAGVVQADAPRHGADLAVPWPARSEGAPAVPRPRSAWIISWLGRRHCCSEGEDPKSDCRSRSCHDCLGIGVVVPRSDKRGGRTGAHSPRATKGLGSEPAGRTGEGSQEAGGDPKGVQRRGEREEGSLADLIVLAAAQLSRRRRKSRHKVKIPFSPGRTDASQKQTDVHSFVPLEPKADGFRNYLRSGQKMSAEELLVDRRSC